MINFWTKKKSNELVAVGWATASLAYHDDPSLINQMRLDNADLDLRGRIAEVGPFVVSGLLFQFDFAIRQVLITDLQSPYLTKTPVEMLAEAKDRWDARKK